MGSSEYRFHACWDAGFVLKHPLLTSVVMGATQMWQLREILDASHVDLSEEVLTEIDAVHERYPNPTP
jgi:aryl-alcohol dehydrogenase-like predicted oxidoreductase